MSELKNTPRDTGSVKWNLLSTVSAMALIVGCGDCASALATEDDSPTVWIELGGQLERVDGGSERFIPPFVSSIEAHGLLSPTEVQTPPRYSNGAEGRVSFEPSGTDWTVSAAVRYGRSNGNKSTHDALPRTQFTTQTRTQLGTHEHLETVHDAKFSDTAVKINESHVILDFAAGKDVGLGWLGSGATSKVSFGVRYAQFNSSGSTSITAEPDYHQFAYILPPPFNVPLHFAVHHTYLASADIDRSFHGFGPSISWDASKPIGGTNEEGKLSVDWGINAAVLFGRQKAKTTHKTSGKFHARYQLKYHGAIYDGIHTAYQTGNASVRSHSVIVPNLGGFAGLTFRVIDAQVSVGYRADFFFGAIDGGIDTRKTYNREFYGPFATISIGLGG